ncbi:MAG: 50S ribosomal protein L13 [Candidatus Bathyarchaeota archaeon]|nr:MAG: 50S ribosomal protein L13 [Candidatus Bathyarchaeota archaeon]
MEGENLYTPRRFQSLRTPETEPYQGGQVVNGQRTTIIDAEGLILGRMASIVAKRLLEGDRIEIVNAEGAVVSGKRKMVIKERKEFLEVGGRERGPLHYRKPNVIVRRTIRGMLPHRKAHGREAYRRLRVHIGVPRELEGAEAESIPNAHVDRLGGRYVTVGEIAKNIGWKV